MFVNYGVRIATIWLALFFVFVLLFANRLNFAGDDAYRWQEPDTFTDQQGWNLAQLLNHWDARWYVGLAEHGYDFRGPQVMSNVVFFPAYPGLLRAVHYLVPISYELLGVIINFLLVVVFAGLLFHWIELRYPRSDASYAVIAALVFPTAVFFLAPYSESLFLVLAVLFSISLEKQKFWLALVVGIIASLTRAMGVLLVIPAVDYGFRYWKLKHSWKYFLPALLPLGTFAYFFWQKFAYGSLLTYFRIEAVWGRAFSVNWDHLWTATSAARSQLTLDVLILLFVLTCAAYLLHRKMYGWSLYTAACVLLPLSTGTFMSIGRYALAAFPIFFIPALLQSKSVRAVWLFVSVMIFAMTTALYVNGHWAG